MKSHLPNSGAKGHPTFTPQNYFCIFNLPHLLQKWSKPTVTLEEKPQQSHNKPWPSSLTPPLPSWEASHESKYWLSRSLVTDVWDLHRLYLLGKAWSDPAGPRTKGNLKTRTHRPQGSVCICDWAPVTIGVGHSSRGNTAWQTSVLQTSAPYFCETSLWISSVSEHEV